MLRFAILLLALTALPAESRAQTPALPDVPADLTEANFARWRDHIRGGANERTWARLPWLASFHAGLTAAAKQGKPLLLWAMNGHPLGCT